MAALNAPIYRKWRKESRPLESSKVDISLRWQTDLGSYQQFSQTQKHQLKNI